MKYLIIVEDRHYEVEKLKFDELEAAYSWIESNYADWVSINLYKESEFDVTVCVKIS